jgi:hypothetical protein
MKDIELYEIKESLYSDVRYYMLLLDYNRPSRVEDFKHIPQFDKEDFNSRSNFMASIILYDDELSEEEKNEAYEIASGFLENKDDCDWAMDYIKIDFTTLYPIYDFTSDVIVTMNRLLDMVCFGKKIETINEKTFNNLSQY